VSANALNTMSPPGSSTQTNSSSLEQSSQASAPRPRLERVDGVALRKDDLKQRRFGVTIESVHYYRDPGESVYCAVLLKTYFELKTGDKLQYALVPLTAKPLRQDTNTAELDEIDISGHLPATVEWVNVAQKSGSKDIHLTPSMKATVLGSGIEMAGVGVNKHGLEELERSFKISLNPVLTVLAGHPTYLDWKFEDAEGIFYPPCVNVLVIVEKKSMNKHESWFPFKLNLEWTLRVDIHNRLRSLFRLAARPDPHAGWFFHFKGEYKPTAARHALEDAKRSGVAPSDVGLHAAVKPWMDAQRSTKDSASPPLPDA